VGGLAPPSILLFLIELEDIYRAVRAESLTKILFSLSVLMVKVAVRLVLILL
jgi:hypothetical protein